MTYLEVENIVNVPDDLDEFQRFAFDRQWSDGLPLIPPTPARVERFLEYYDRPADYVIGRVPPRLGNATVAAVAANAIMAGCRPEHLPIVITALTAAFAPSVNLYGMQATTHPCAMMVMINGPIGREIGVNSKAGTFGSGPWANGAIGRAVRLCMQNIGGSYAGETDRSTLGSPAKYTFCFAENEEDSPWAPFHTTLGFDAQDTTVTVCAAESPHNIEDHISTDSRHLLGTLAYSIANVGANNAYQHSDLFVGICPEHAEVLKRENWSREDVQEYLFIAARIPYSRWRDRGIHGVNAHAKYLSALEDDMGVPMTKSQDDYRVFCIGGPGLHSCWIPNVGCWRSNTEVVRTADGRPARSFRDFCRS